jgi:hypothetical protein
MLRLIFVVKQEVPFKQELRRTISCFDVENIVNSLKYTYNAIIENSGELLNWDNFQFIFGPRPLQR